MDVNFIRDANLAAMEPLWLGLLDPILWLGIAASAVVGEYVVRGWFTLAHGPSREDQLRRERDILAREKEEFEAQRDAIERTLKACQQSSPLERRQNKSQS